MHRTSSKLIYKPVNKNRGFNGLSIWQYAFQFSPAGHPIFSFTFYQIVVVYIFQGDSNIFFRLFSFISKKQYQKISKTVVIQHPTLYLAVNLFLKYFFQI